MSNHLQELRKIKRETSSSNRSKAIVAADLKQISPIVNNALSKNREERKQSLMNLLNMVTIKRQAAFRNGSSSYSDPKWAGPAACESWILSLIKDDKHELQSIELVIEELKNPERKEELKSWNFWSSFIIVVAGILAYNTIGTWFAILIVIIGFIIKGWKNRFDGPFNTN